MAYQPVNPLCSVADVKNALRITDANDDDRIGVAVDAASRQIEAETGRVFRQDTIASSRLFVAETPFLVAVDDFFDTADLVVETLPYGANSTQSVTWSTTDYQLEPLNAIRNGQAWPYERIRAVASLLFPIYGGIAYPLPYAQALVRITTKWGWNYVPTPVKKAAIVQSVALFKADDVPFGATPFGETGIVRLRVALHPTAAMLLADYSENGVEVA